MPARQGGRYRVRPGGNPVLVERTDYQSEPNTPTDPPETAPVSAEENQDADT